MVNIFDEVRIIFRGPCERLFIAYKPVGWHVCSPSQKKFKESVSTVIGASLGIPEDSIKFPSKLKISQNGLVIGTTDEPMYSQIRNIIQNKQCTKSYTCLVDTNFTLFDGIKVREHSESVGEIRFGLKLLEKKSQFDPNVEIFNISTREFSSQDSVLTEETDFKTLKFRLIRLENQLSTPGNTINSAEIGINSNENSINSSEIGVNSTEISSKSYCLLEIQTTDPVVDKNLEEILDLLGVKILKSNQIRGIEDFKLMLLNMIQLPHPILKNKKITTQINFPLELLNTLI